MTPAGYRDLLEWAKTYGDVEAFGVEGTGSYGAGLSRFLLSRGQVVIEVNRPSRQARRRNGKSDPADADAAASAVLSGDANACRRLGTPTSRWAERCGSRGRRRSRPEPRPSTRSRR